MMHIRNLMITFSLVLLSACSNLSLSDLATGTGAVVGAGIGSLTGNPAVVATTSAVGATVGSAVVGDSSVGTAEACAANPEVCHTIAVSNVVSDSIHWIIGGVVVLIIAAWLIPGPQRLFWRKPKDFNGIE